MLTASEPPARICDLLVIGTGAAALSAALTALVNGLSVVLIEKEEVFGGASARSGGGVWIPNSRHVRAAGIDDSAEAAMTFIRHEAGDRLNEPAARAFVDNAPAMLDFIEANSPVRFGFVNGFPDYHCDSPGGSTRGRAHYPLTWDAAPLGRDLARMRLPLEVGTFLTMQVGSHETARYLAAGRDLGSFLYVLKCMALRVRDQFRAGRTLRLGSGNALVGGLASAVLARGGDILTSTPARRLIVADGRVTGAEVDTAQGKAIIHARRGVVVATGGFPHDAARRATLFPPGATAPEVWGMLPYGNSGDGIRMGEAVGAQVNDRMRFPIALTPITRLHGGEGGLQTMPIFQGRGKPGLIGVTRDGRRFTNEGRSYHDFCAALLAKEAGEPEAVAWLVFDHRHLRRYGAGPVLPWPIPHRRHLRSGYLKTGRSIRELAANAGIDADGLEASVARYNGFAKEARDPDFHRGSNAYDLAHGDPDHRPNPCIGPIEHGPYYAIRVFAGSVGTFVGLKTDGDARVLDTAGQPIPGLYAAGNDMASITGGDYISGGCTLGPGMTFGYLAARHAARHAARGADGSAAEQDAGRSACA